MLISVVVGPARYCSNRKVPTSTLVVLRGTLNTEVKSLLDSGSLWKYKERLATGSELWELLDSVVTLEFILVLGLDEEVFDVWMLRLNEEKLVLGSVFW